MSIVHIDWHPDGPALRRFGRTVIIGSLLIAAALHFLKGWTTAAEVLAGVGVVIGGLGLTGARIALPGYWFWMGIAFVMGNIMGRILLSIFYYTLITPMGLIRRLVNDKLQLRARGRDTYWRDLPPDDGTRYERQF